MRGWSSSRSRSTRPHPVLAATVPKLRALARARRRGGRARATGRPRGAARRTPRRGCSAAARKAGRGVRFETALARELPRAAACRRRPHVPDLRGARRAARPPARVPVVLWYTHWHASATLAPRSALSNAVATVDARSFPLESREGAGDRPRDRPRRSSRAPRPANVALRLLALGRYSPAKGLDDVAARASRRSPEARARARARPRRSTLEERAPRGARAPAGARARRRARLHGPCRRREVPDLLAANDALVNNMRAGATDKVVFEAAASCVPVLASNPVFDRLLPRRAALRARRPAASSRTGSRSSPRSSPEERARSGARCARGSRASTRSSLGRGASLELARERARPPPRTRSPASRVPRRTALAAPAPPRARVGRPAPAAARERARRVRVRRASCARSACPST